MTVSTVAFTNLNDSKDAGAHLGNQIIEKMHGRIPDVVVVFASAIYDHSLFLRALKETSKTVLLVGSTSGGEFTSGQSGTDSACAVAIFSTEMKFSTGLGCGIRASRDKVAEDLLSICAPLNDYRYRYFSGMIFADSLSGYSDELVDVLTAKTLGRYQFFGGGAADNAMFESTKVFFDTEAYTDSAVILEILSNKPVGIGAVHSWKPVGKKMRVTEASGLTITSLNARPAVELFEEHACATGQSFDTAAPLPFLLHNVLGIEVGGQYKLRVPCGVLEDGSVAVATAVPEGAYVYFMETGEEEFREATASAARQAVRQLGGTKPNVAFFFDCVATRLRIGQTNNWQLQDVAESMEDTPYAGCYTFGQVARINGQFSGFQNCTPVVCIIPE